MVMESSAETYAIRGVAMRVHNKLGQGFSESVYQELMERLLAEADIPYEREKEMPIYVDGIKLKSTFRPDFVCYNSVIVELKAVRELLREHEAQVINYLKVSGLHVGLLINFGEESLVVRRYYRAESTDWTKP